MAGSYVGLDIGTNQIKVAEVRRAGNQLQLVALGVGPTPTEAYENSIVVDPQALGLAVKNLLKQAGITSREVISSVSGQSAVVVRVIEVPQMNSNELAETMKWEVDKHVPFATNEVIMDYAPIDRPGGYGDGQNMEVLLAVAQQDMIEKHVEMLKAAGLKAKAIDVEPLALGRTLLDVGQGTTQPGHTVAIINLGASSTEINVYRDKLLAFPRPLPLAGDALTRAISETLRVDPATAESHKREYGEVIMDQMGQPAPDFAPGPFGGGGQGFQDFSQPQTVVPSPFGTPQPFPPQPSTGPTSTPSGRMPFDFSTPGDAPAPAPTPFGTPEEDTPPTPFGTPPAPQPAAPAFQAPAPNLPAPTSGTGDPNRDSMRMQVFAAIAPILAELAQELRRSLDYYRGRAGDAHIDEVLLTGGTSKLKNLAPFLESELGIPVRVADTLQSMQVTSKNHSEAHLKEIAPVLPISIGLSVRELIAVPAAASKGKKRK